MSNRLFQGIIHQMQPALDRVIGVIDESGLVIACSELSIIGETRVKAKEEMSYTTDIKAVDGYTYHHIGNGATPEFIVLLRVKIKQQRNILLFWQSRFQT